MVVLACLAWAPRAAVAQVPVGTQHVTFWRGDLRIIALRDRTRVTLIDIASGNALPAASWLGNFNRNPFTLGANESFEASSLGQTYRVRVIAEAAGGPVEDKPVVVWTGQLAASLVHPLTVPTDQNAWMSYVPDFLQVGDGAGSELGREFIGFTSRDMWVFVQKQGDPVRVTVEDLVTNVEADSDDTFVLDRTSPYLVHEDAEVEIYKYDQFEDDTFHLTSNAPTSVLVGISSTAFPDWLVSPPSYGVGERGRELGTLFYVFASRWLAIMPILDDTTVQVTDLSDGDDTETFTLASGDRFSTDFDMYLADPLGRANQPAVPRAAGPAVQFHFPAGGAIDDDLLKIESDRPIVVQVGPSSSDTFEFADVAYSVPVGTTEELIYAYAQNGGAEDFQMFSFAPGNPVTITSLSHTQGFGTNTNHDYQLPAPTAYLGGNATYDDYFWSSPIWAGEMLRIESQFPVQVMSGDYDSPSFGAFIPFVTRATTGLPVANAGPDEVVCPGATVTLDGSDSFDSDFIAGSQTEQWTWDLDTSVDSDGNGVADDDVDATGSTVSATFPPGTTTVKLTYTDDDGEMATDFKVITVADTEPPTASCPSEVVAFATDFDGGVASPMATASDACDPDPVLTNDRTAGGADATDRYPCGPTLVTFTATDAAGFQSACTTTVRILADLTAESVGPALRVSRPASLPLLDWTLRGPPPAELRFAVLKGNQPWEVRSLQPSSVLDAGTWLDGAPDGRVVYYDVRLVGCGGGLSPD